MIPSGPVLALPGEYVNPSPGSFQFLTVFETVLLSPTRAVAAYPAANGDLVLKVIDPSIGQLVRTIRVAGFGVAGDSPFVMPGGMLRLADDKLAIVMEPETSPPGVGFRLVLAAVTVTLDGAIGYVNGDGYVVSSFDQAHVQDTGGVFFNKDTHVFEFMYWSVYFTGQNFTAWRISIDFENLTSSEPGQIHPSMGHNEFGAIGYYGTLPIPSLGGAIGCIDTPDSRRTGRAGGHTMWIVNNQGTILDRVPWDPTGNYKGNDRFFTQIDDTNSVALTYSRWNPDALDSSGRPRGNYDLWCRTYQVIPDFQQLTGDVFLSPWTDRFDTALGFLGFNPYDIAKYMTPVGHIAIESDFGNFPLRHGTAVEYAYQPYRRPNAAPGLFELDSPAGPHFPINANREAYCSSLGNLTFIAQSMSNLTFTEPDIVTPVAQDSWQLFAFLDDSAYLRLNQRTDGLGVSGHPRLVATQAPHAPRVGTTNVLN